MLFSEPEPLPPGTVLAYARQQPILHEERLIKASFEDRLAFGDVRERDGAQLVRWKLGSDAAELEATNPRARALIVEVQGCIERTERLLGLLRLALDERLDPIQIAPDAAREFGPQLLLRRDADVARGVPLDRREVELLNDVLAKTVQTLRWALRKPRVVEDAGRVRLIGWGYCPPNERSKDQTMVPLRIKHFVDGAGDEARIVFHWDSHPSFTGAFVLKEKVSPSLEFQPIADAPPGSVSVRIPFRAEVHTGRYFITTTNAAGSHSSNTVEVDARRPSAPPPPRSPEPPPPPAAPPPRQPPPQDPERRPEPVPPPLLQVPLLQVRAAPDKSPHIEVEWSPPAGLDPNGVRTEVEFEEPEGSWVALASDPGAAGKLVDPTSDPAKSRTYRARYLTDTEASGWSTASWTARRGCGCWPIKLPPLGCAPLGCASGCFAWLATLPLWLALLLLLLAAAALLGLLLSLLSLLGSLFGFALPSWMTWFADAPSSYPPIGPEVVVAPERASGEAELATGEIQLTLRWSTKDDLDLLGRAPHRQPVWFNQPRVANGFLDRDDNRDHSNPAPVENICWTNPCEAGVYEVFVKHWAADPLAGEAGAVPFVLTIKSGTDVGTIEGKVNPGELRSVRFNYPASGELPSTLGTPQAEAVPLPHAPKAAGGVRSGFLLPPSGDSVVVEPSPRTGTNGDASSSIPSVPLPREANPSGQPDNFTVPVPAPTPTPQDAAQGDFSQPAPGGGRSGESEAASPGQRQPRVSGDPSSGSSAGPQVVSTAASDIIPRLVERFAHARGSRWDFKQDDGGSFFHLESEEGSIEFGVSIWVDFSQHPGVDPRWERNLDSETVRRFGFSRSVSSLHTPAAVEAYPKARWVNLRIEERPLAFGQIVLSDFSGPSGITVQRQRRHVEVLGAPAVWWVAYKQGPRGSIAMQLEWWSNSKSTLQSSGYHWNEHLAGQESWQVVVPEPSRLEAQLNLKGDRGDGIKTEVAHTGVFWLEILKR